MKEALQEFTGTRILVVGDLMLDRYWSGDTARISPEAPVPVVRVRELDERPGGAANVALNIAALGAQAGILGIVGKDESAQTLARLLAATPNIASHLLAVAGVTTVTKWRVLSRHQQLLRLDFEDALPDTAHPSLVDAFRQQLSSCQAVVLSDYAKGALRDAQALIKQARAAGKPVLVDPKRNDFSVYAGASLLTPNLGEFETVVGPCASDAALENRALNLLKAHDIEALLITRSDKGMSLILRQGKPVHIPAQAREVFDVTGAGDTVIATMAVACAAGLNWEDAARLANLAAGIVVGKLGAATVNVAELRRALTELENTHRGVMDEAQLLQAVADARAHGETIVMTNGCFDLLHAGHVHYLQQARQLGDRLIVAVNDDASMRGLKGPQRPIVPLAQRMAVLAALADVDWVVPFSEATPQRLICAIKPDVLVKGGDYRIDEIAGRECAGTVRVLPFLDGHSTSAIVERIRQSTHD